MSQGRRRKRKYEIDQEAGSKRLVWVQVENMPG